MDRLRTLTETLVENESSGDMLAEAFDEVSVPGGGTTTRCLRLGGRSFCVTVRGLPDGTVAAWFEPRDVG